MTLDLTGQRYGRWEVLHKADNRGVYTAHLCRCSCGIEKVVTTRALRSGASTSCGCYYRESWVVTGQKRLIDLTGKRFGRLVVLSRSGNDKSKGAVWHCICDCGNEKDIRAASLKNGDTTSCGCYHKEVVSNNIGADSYGWHGGRYEKDGYVFIYIGPESSLGKRDSYKLEHRLVMEEHLGRPLFPDEVIHHKNGVRNDNRLENLELCIKSHPPGQRLEDLIPYWKDMLKRYNRYE